MNDYYNYVHMLISHEIVDQVIQGRWVVDLRITSFQSLKMVLYSQGLNWNLSQFIS